LARTYLRDPQDASAVSNLNIVSSLILFTVEFRNLDSFSSIGSDPSNTTKELGFLPFLSYIISIYLFPVFSAFPLSL
jgi:hypothetical protein